jgi:hypothetical protein
VAVDDGELFLKSLDLLAEAVIVIGKRLDAALPGSQGRLLGFRDGSGR